MGDWIIIVLAFAFWAIIIFLGGKVIIYVGSILLGSGAGTEAGTDENLTARLAFLERELFRLKERLDLLESDTPTPSTASSLPPKSSSEPFPPSPLKSSSVAIPTPPAPSPTPATPAIDLSSPLPQTAPAAPPLPPPPARPSRVSSPPREEGLFTESNIGLNIFNKLGILFVLVGLLFLVILIFPALPVLGKALLCYAFASMFAGVAWYFREDLPDFSHTLTCTFFILVHLINVSIHLVEPMRLISSPMFALAVIAINLAIFIEYALRRESRELVLFIYLLAYGSLYAVANFQAFGGLVSTLLTATGVYLAVARAIPGLAFLCNLLGLFFLFGVHQDLGVVKGSPALSVVFLALVHLAIFEWKGTIASGSANLLLAQGGSFLLVNGYFALLHSGIRDLIPWLFVGLNVTRSFFCPLRVAPSVFAGSIFAVMGLHLVFSWGWALVGDMIMGFAGLFAVMAWREGWRPIRLQIEPADLPDPLYGIAWFGTIFYLPIMWVTIAGPLFVERSFHFGGGHSSLGDYAIYLLMVGLLAIILLRALGSTAQTEKDKLDLQGAKEGLALAILALGSSFAFYHLEERPLRVFLSTLWFSGGVAAIWLELRITYYVALGAAMLNTLYSLLNRGFARTLPAANGLVGLLAMNRVNAEGSVVGSGADFRPIVHQGGAVLLLTLLDLFIRPPMSIAVNAIGLAIFFEIFLRSGNLGGIGLTQVLLLVNIGAGVEVCMDSVPFLSHRLMTLNTGTLLEIALFLASIYMIRRLRSDPLAVATPEWRETQVLIVVMGGVVTLFMIFHFYLLTLSLAVLGFMFIFFGFENNEKTYRRVGLWLTLFSAAKGGTVDFYTQFIQVDVNPILKIISFIGLGLFFLGINYLYNRFDREFRRLEAELEEAPGE